MLRKAKIHDVKSIHEILIHCANQFLLLPRSLIELYDHLRDFYVIENIKVKGSLLGVCSLRYILGRFRGDKIWADCVRCPKFPDCDEIAMILTL